MPKERTIRQHLLEDPDSQKKWKMTEKKINCCLTLSPSAKMSLEVYAVKRGFTGISALIEFWAHNLDTMEGAKNGKKIIN